MQCTFDDGENEEEITLINLSCNPGHTDCGSGLCCGIATDINDIDF